MKRQWSEMETWPLKGNDGSEGSSEGLLTDFGFGGCLMVETEVLTVGVLKVGFVEEDEGDGGVRG